MLLLQYQLSLNEYVSHVQVARGSRVGVGLKKEKLSASVFSFVNRLYPTHTQEDSSAASDTETGPREKH